MSTQITTQKILAFDEYADFGSLPGIEGYIYIDKAEAEAYLWDSTATPPAYVRIGEDTPIPPDPTPLTFVDAATVGALSFSPVYNNGTGGVGATLTASSPGVLRDTSGTGKIDSSYVPVVGGLILVKNQALQYQNGIYVITNVGSPNPGGTFYQLTRVADFDQATELFPLQVNVLQGTVNANQYFNQATPSPLVIGTSNLVFSPANYATAAGPIAFVDVATTTALPACVYANGTTNPSYPGLNATLTASAFGTVLTVDGLTASTSATSLGTFTRVLVKDQANKAHNGDYVVVNGGVAGSSTVKWQLRRINYAANGFFRFNRYFMVSNTQSTFAGKIFITSPNATPLSNLTVGTAAINIVEYGGSALIIGTTPITSGTIGRLIFQGTGNVLQQDSNLFWDNTNKRLGIGATPDTSTRLDIRAQGALSSDTILRIRNSINTLNFLTFAGNGQFTIGSGAITGGDRAISIGTNAQANSTFATVIGAFATAGASSDASVALGYGSSVSNAANRGISLGFNASTTGDASIALGERSSATASGSIAIGSASVASATQSIMIGKNTTNSIANSNAFSNGLNGFSFFNDINSNHVVNSAVVPVHNISYLNTTKNVIYLGTAVKPTSTIKNGVQSYTNYRTISAATSTSGSTATGVANLKTLTFSAGTNMSALTVGSRIIVTNAAGEQTHANIVSVVGLVVTIDSALVNINTATLNANATTVTNSSVVIISDFHQEIRNDLGNIVKLFKQDLPTVPTPAEIATFLSNLGLANLV